MSVTPARVSVGIPVYNGEQYLPEALRSVQEQDLSDIDIVISDNASTDATEQICREAAAEDSRIAYFRSPENHGGAWNFNRVFELSRSPLFTWMAADDVIRPSFLSRCVEALDVAGTSAVLAFPRTQLINEQGDIFEDLGDGDLDIDQPSPHRRIARLLQMQASHIVYGVIRAETLRTTRGIRSTVGDDMVLLTELACRGTFVRVPEQLFLQRRHDTQFSAQGHDQVRWYKPSGGSRFAFPQTRVSMELFAAVATSHLGVRDSARALAVIPPSWTIPRWRGVAGDVRTALGIPKRARQQVT